uniref:C2H2-type domain-containing protein n=1 Tax=Sinocyclocheilus anshuiensis TaxID=1608454 RepID=A0A671KKN5_9TELE
MDKNVIVTKQLGTDPPESLQSATDLLSHSIPTSGRKKGKNLKRPIRSPKLSSLRDQNNIVTPEKNDNEKTKLDNVEMIPPITAETCKITPKTGVLCSSPTDLSSNLVKEFKKYKVEEHSAEPRGKDSFDVSVQSYTDNTGVSIGICHLISSNVVKENSEPFFLDTKMKPNTELKCTEEADGLSVETSGEKVLNSTEPENALQPSTERKVDGFMQDSEDCVVMPNKVTNNRTIRSNPKEIVKKPLTCKYCGVSFRHITAYTIHRRIHTGDKPYKCKICGKTFAQRSKLKSHRNVHKQDTSFPCPCCSRMFLQKDELLCHFKVHL